MNHSRILYSCSIILFFFFLPAAANAAVRIESVIVGLDGYVRAERWVPVVFHFHNEGGRFQGKIQIRKGQTIFEKSVELGESSRKRMEVLYYHSSAYESLRYSLLNGQGQAVYESALEPHLLNYRDNLILVLSAADYDHQFLNGQPNPWSGKTYVAYYKPNQLFNEWLGYSNADGIALGLFSPAQILPAQWKGIAQYVAGGGLLILSAATDFSVLQDPLMRDHLPKIQPELNRSTSGDFLVGYWVKKTTDPFPPFTLPAQTIYKRDCDRELVTLTPGISLVTASPYYKGSINYFGFDYTRMPDDLKTLFSRAWNYINFPSTPGGDPVLNVRFRQKLDDNPRVQKDLYNIPGLRLPDLKWFALFFFVYICAIGPFQFLILKFLKKGSLLWLSFPAIILLFTVASFGYTRYRQDGRGKITSVSVVEVFPELQQQTVYQVYGAVMAESGTFDFQSPSESSFLRKTSFRSFNNQPEPYTLSQDLPRRLVGETMKPWTFRAFDAFDSQNMSLNLSLKFDVQQDRLQGEFTNNSPYDIKESFFLYDSRNSAQLGTVKSGSTKTFVMALTSSSYPPFAEKHLRDLLHLYAASYSNPHFVLGVLDHSEGELIVNGRNRKTENTTYIAVYANSETGRVINPWLLTNY